MSFLSNAQRGILGDQMWFCIIFRFTSLLGVTRFVLPRNIDIFYFAKYRSSKMRWFHVPICGLDKKDIRSNNTWNSDSTKIRFEHFFDPALPVAGTFKNFFDTFMHK